MANKEVKTLTVDNVTYDIKDAQARADIANKQDKLPDGTTGYFLKKTTTGVEWAEGAAPGDDSTIKVDTDTNKLYAVAVKDSRDETLATNVKSWTGTKEQYDAVTTKSEDTIYYVEETAGTEYVTEQMLENTLTAIYPIGSLYIGTQSSCPMSGLIKNSVWTLVGTGRSLWCGSGTNGGTLIEAGLPDHQHTVSAYGHPNSGNTSYFYPESGNQLITLTSSWASASNPIYGNSDTVQPPAYVVNVWRRVA